MIQSSVAAHAAAAGSVAAFAEAWPWALGAVALNHALLGAAGLWPRSTWLGPNLRRLGPASHAQGEVALTFDDGPDPDVTPRVMDLLDAHQLKATFFVIGERARRHPGLIRELQARGHGIQNHSMRHRHDFALRGPHALRHELAQAQALLADITGRRPEFFRAPAGLRNPLLDPVLHGLGLSLVSWTRRGFDTRTVDPGRVLARLQRGLRAGDILLLHDCGAAHEGSAAPVVLQVLPPLARALAAVGLRTVTLERGLADTSEHVARRLPAARRETAAMGVS